MSHVDQFHIDAIVYVHAKRGHAHLFTLVDPCPATVRKLALDPTVEVLTTEGDTYVRVLDVVERDLVVADPIPHVIH
jgi:hypothetical protein